MNDQVLLSKNGQLVVGIPLYRRNEEEIHLEYGIKIGLTYTDKPIAYLIDCGPYGNILMNEKFVKKNFQFLGDL